MKRFLCDSKNSIEEVTFTINGTEYKVSPDVDGLTAETSLNTYIRDYAKLKGTKAMCLEGGCGSCIVSVTSEDPVTKRDIHYAVNSCLVTVFSCQGWHITTVEGIGNQKDGYHPIQSRLAKFNGTQCGFCSPGMVMNMYSLYNSEDPNDMTMKEIENSFGGNMCRCTGYRPIVDAFKSLCTDADPALLKKCRDIEDLKICSKSGKKCDGSSCKPSLTDLRKPEKSKIRFQVGDAKWYKVYTLADLYATLKEIGDAKYMLVAGNTGHGVFRRDSNIEVFIDVMSIPDLRNFTIGPMEVVLGGNMNLTTVMKVMRKVSKEKAVYLYFNEIADHIDVIANVPVRNTGTIAGNLAMKHSHDDFPSDVFLTLETFGAKLVIGSRDGSAQTVSLLDFLKLDMNRKVILSVKLRPLDSSYKFRTYKIMPRAQNAHAYVNAGFCFKLKTDNTVEEASIVFGGINSHFIHAIQTEKYLIGKNIFDNSVLQGAYKTLEGELNPDHVLPDAEPAFRRALAIALFYKAVLSNAPANKVNKLYASGGPKFDRSVSSGIQEYDSNKSEWPLRKPIPKLEAMVQCSGEAKYVFDHPDTYGQDLHASFVLARAPPQSVIKSVDTSKALQLPGVVAFIDKNNIPGKNTFTPKESGLSEDEEIFCSGKIMYNGQPIGLIVAKNKDIANKAVKLVNVEYAKSERKPLVTIRDVLKSNEKERVKLGRSLEPKSKGTDVKHVIKGSFDIGSQYHYTMETQGCVCVPTEDSLDVFASTQWMDLSHIAISKALNIPENKINMVVRRLGGAYGAKISRASMVACACAAAAHTLNKPVHLHLTLENNMDAIGKRYPCSADYEVGVDDKGKIQYLKNCFYSDYGYLTNEPLVPSTVTTVQNCYDANTWEIKGYGVFTDTPVNTYCRAPSTTEGVAMIESIMDHIAMATGLDPIEVRIQNMHKDENPLPTLVSDMKKDTDYDKRKKEVDDFNKENRWRKKGISLVPLQYPMEVFGNFTVYVAIYSADGTVAVSHGGIEMGQGINTKVAQVVAYIFGIDLEMVSIKPSNTLTAPNNMVTGGSVTSEACCLAAIKCCKDLLKRLDPIKEKHNNPDWKTLIREARMANVELAASYMFTMNDGLRPYEIWGVAVAEVEVDLLTGLIQILRCDILEDTGESISPEVDVGQVEGAFVMGIGYWLMEVIMHDPEDGKLLNNRTWTYKPPGVKDIPIDFRVKFRRNAPNPIGVLRSKATGEPPLNMSVVIPLSIRYALASARKDSNINNSLWFPMNGPTSTENIFMNALSNYADYKID